MLSATGLWLTANEIDSCENLGIYIARDEAGYDGTGITRNRIRNIRFSEGGDGLNGNAINAFRADNVVISNNVLSDCAFSAVRLCATRDCQITGNKCNRLSEVAIFSEFGFSGSVASGNIIDGVAQGIAITNFNEQGRLAVCSAGGRIYAMSAPRGIFCGAAILASGCRWPRGQGRRWYRII